MSKCPQNGVEYAVQLFPEILGKESQHEVTVLLKQLVLLSITAIGDRIRKMLRSVQFHRNTSASAK